MISKQIQQSLLVFIKLVVLLLTTECLALKREVLILSDSTPAQKSYPIDLGIPGQELAVFGWAKPAFSDVQRNNMIVFEVSKQKDDDHQEDVNDYCLLSLSISRTCVHISYRMIDQDVQIPENACQFIIQSEELNQWFFFYVGHSPRTTGTFFYLKFQTREFRKEILGTMMNPVDKIKIFLENKLYLNQFIGTLKRLAVQFGEGAYITNNFTILTLLNEHKMPDCAILFEDDIYSNKFFSVCEESGMLQIDFDLYDFLYVPKGNYILELFSKDKQTVINLKNCLKPKPFFPLTVQPIEYAIFYQV